MNYKDNAMYKAYRLKLDYLKNKLSGEYDHTLSKLGMFAEDAFTEQQERIAALEAENARLVKALRDILSEISREPWIADIENIAREALQAEGAKE